MRSFACLCTVLAACGFELPSGVAPDAAGDRDAAIDARVDAAIDAAPDAAPDARIEIDAPPPLVCPSTYNVTISGSTSRYRIVSTNASFAQHHSSCNSALAGATHLAVFETVAELDAISALADQAPRPNDGRFFVGAVQMPDQDDVDDGWVWLTGGAVPAPMWGQGHPDDDGDFNEDDHEQQLAAIDSGERMNDMSGQINYGAICECDGVPLDPTALSYLP